MHSIVRILTVLAVAALPYGAAASAAPDPAQSAIPGELRLFALAPEQTSAIEALHQQGWMEADGRLLPQQDFPELYARIGRAWTRARIATDLFAVPNLVDRHDDPNPYGVLGPDDLVMSGLPQPRPTRTIYFIYLGRSAGALGPRWK
jgi:tail collar domain